MTFTRVWDPNIPAGGTTLASDIDLVFRQLKVDIVERMVSLGIANFATTDPVGFAYVHAGQAASGFISGSDNIAFFATDTVTPNLIIQNGGNVLVRGDLTVGAEIIAALLVMSGLATFNGGITVAASHPATFNGPADFNENVTLNNAQSACTPVVVAASGAAMTIDWDLGNVRDIQLTANCTFTFSNPKTGATYLLRLAQDATGSRVVTWPSSVRWPNNTAIALTTGASKVDLVTLFYDGTNYLMNVAGFAYVP